MNCYARSRAMAALVAIAVFANVVSPVIAQSEDTPPTAATGEGKITGQVAVADNSAVVGATIIAYHLSTETVFRSEVTDGKSNFALGELPYGYYDLAVQTADGLFVADQVINVPPSGKASLSMTLSPEMTSDTHPRGFAGLDQAATGVAQVETKGSAGGFWKSSSTMSAQSPVQ